ncbi:hypothetical protein [Sphingomonas sp.]|uniref:hypothetical protein n=1 Tax=Sphingomonas sp. TaxID=28214 RepID=UPI001EB877F4|nr:hypothetical protein [Sphingomonas sp.]MBX3594530.1 hypothetical protein [Sphingomonas sp.]
MLAALFALMQAVTAPIFGQPFAMADGTRREARFSTYGEGLLDPKPDLVRRADYDAAPSSLQSGAFPAPARGDEEPVELRVRLAIDRAGTPGACAVIRASGNAAFDAHVCPHLMRHLRHSPALDWRGERVGDTLTRVVRYRFAVVEDAPKKWTGAPVPVLARAEPRPQRPIDAAAIGLNEPDVPAQITGVSGGLAIDSAGRVTACTLMGATRIDLIDLRICQRLRTIAFTPLVDRSGRAVAGRYGFSVKR